MKIRRLDIEDHLCLVDFNINFDTQDGGCSTILIGENGTGKSTTLEVILEIFMSFDSPSMESKITYDYIIEYEYAQKNIYIEKREHYYQIKVDDAVFEGNYSNIRNIAHRESIFPQRIVTFYSGANDRFNQKFRSTYAQYTNTCKARLNEYIKSITPGMYQYNYTGQFPKRKYNRCIERLTDVYLLSLLCGNDSDEKEHLKEQCHLDAIQTINVSLEVQKIPPILQRINPDDRINGLSVIIEFIDAHFVELFQSGFLNSYDKRLYFQLGNIEYLGLDAISLYNFFEKLIVLFGAQIDVTVLSGDSSVKCRNLSEGQRQLIKIFGMLGICKSEDCLVLMDEPDAYMNPKWKYEIKAVIDNVLSKAINTQAIIATHDPLVINGVDKKYIRIFTHNTSLAENNRFYVTKVVTPTEETEGMGIDGLLQSQYYRLPTSYDKPTSDKFNERQQLYIKLINNEISSEEKERLKQLTRELGALPKAYTTIDFLYDDFIKVYRNSPLYHKEYLSFDELERRRTEIEEIINALYEEQI
ncbi:MAG: AAA family ATPase [Clostridia bacterium]|nr:AAA family ATPase [Clostridia bacterium]